MQTSNSQASTPLMSQARVRSLRKINGGFSLIEMMIVVFVLSIVMGAVFRSIALTQQTSVTQQVKVDLTQQVREFMDQLTRDLRSSGYPNLRNVSNNTVDLIHTGNCPDGNTNIIASPCDPSNGVGLIKIDVGQLWFAGDVDGTQDPGSPAGNAVAQVKVIKYDVFQTGPGCPCIRRSEYPRANYADPVADAAATTAVDQMEIQGVQNGTTGDPIFSAYNPQSGAALALPMDFTNNGPLIATVNSIQVVLEVQSSRPDSTGAYPVTRVTSSVALNNCSQAWGGTRNSFAC